MTALENNNWDKVNYNYEKVQSEISSGDLKLDYDDNKRLEIAKWIANNMIQYDEFRKIFYSFNKNVTQTYFDLDEEWSALPNLKTKPSEAEILNVNVDELYEPYISFSDSLNLAFAEMLLPDSLLNRIKTSEQIIDISYYQENIDIILKRILNKDEISVNKRIELIKERVADLQRNNIAIKKELHEKMFKIEKNNVGMFYKGMPITELQNIPYHQILKFIEPGPGDDFFLYKVYNDNELLFELISWDLEKINLISINSDKIKTSSGISIGSSYKDFKALGIPDTAQIGFAESFISGVFFKMPSLNKHAMFVFDYSTLDNNNIPDCWSEKCFYENIIPDNAIINKIWL